MDAIRTRPDDCNAGWRRLAWLALPLAAACTSTPVPAATDTAGSGQAEVVGADVGVTTDGTAAGKDAVETSDGGADVPAEVTGTVDVAVLVDTAPGPDGAADVAPLEDVGPTSDAPPDPGVTEVAVPDAVSDAATDSGSGPDTAPIPDAVADPDTGPAPDTGPVADTAPDSGPDLPKDTGPPCPGSTPKPDNSCCPAGQSWDVTANTCATPGPIGCTGTAAECQPKWCLEWLDATGKACPAWSFACAPQGRACTAAEVAAGAGCKPGELPATVGGACEPAGGGVPLPPGAVWQGDDVMLPAGLQAQVVEEVKALEAAKGPKLLAPYWCDTPAGPASCPDGNPPGTNGAPDAPLWVPTPTKEWPCPPGFTAGSSAGSKCVPDVAACPADAFAGVQDGVNTVFVDGSFAGTSTGKRAAPFKTLVDAAFALVKTGGTLAIAEGTYPGAAIDTDKPLTVVGRCAKLVKLVGKSDQAVLHAGGAAVLKVSGVSVSAGVEMVRIDGPASAELTNVDVGDGARFGVVAKGGGKVSLKNVFIHDLLPTPADGSQGTGVYVDGGASATLEYVRITKARNRAIHCEGAGVQCKVTFAYLDNTQVEQKSGEGGVGISASGGAKVEGLGVLVADNKTAGVLAHGPGTFVQAKGVAIMSTSPAPANALNGMGILALAGAKVLFVADVVSSNTTVGIKATGSGTSVSIVGSMIHFTKPAADKSGGQAIVVDGGASLHIEGSLASGTTEAVVASDTGTKLSAKWLALDLPTQPSAKDGSGGVGIAVAAGANATLTNVNIHKAAYAGLYCSNASVSIQDLGVFETQGLPTTGGYGIIAQQGCQLTGKGKVWLDQNRTIGLYVTGAGTTAEFQDLLVTNTLPRNSDNWGGRGVQVDEGAKLQVGGGSRVSANRDFGIQVSGANSVLDATGLVIDGTLPRADGWSGRGLHLEALAVAKLADVKILGNRDVGLSAAGDFATLNVAGPLLIGATQPRSDGKYGRGIQIVGGAVLSAVGANNWVRSTGNAEAGVVVIGKNTALQVTSLQTHANGNRGTAILQAATADVGQWQSLFDKGAGVWVHGAGSVARAKGLAVLDPQGRGIEAQYEGQVVAHRAVVAHAQGLGAFAFGAGARVLLLGGRLPHTKADGQGQFGHALQAQDDGEVALFGGEIAGGRQVGVHARVGKVKLAGVVLGGIQALPTDPEKLAAGLAVSHYGQAMVSGCRLWNLAGVGVADLQGQLSLDSVVVGQIAPAGNLAADAVAAQIPTALTGQRLWLTGAGRAGVLLLSDSASLASSRISGNAVGVANPPLATVSLPASVVQGNSKDFASDGGWTLPALPGAALVAAVLEVSGL